MARNPLLLHTGSDERAKDDKHTTERLAVPWHGTHSCQLVVVGRAY